jgi:hypothetical protein
MLKKIGRIIVFIISVLVIVLCIGGIVGAWWLNSVASNVTLKAFSVVEGGIEIVDAGVGRVDTLIGTGDDQHGRHEPAGEQAGPYGAQRPPGDPPGTHSRQDPGSHLPRPGCAGDRERCGQHC